MNYRDRPWHRRIAQMGDLAEGKFAALNPKAVKIGLDRPPWRVNDMPTVEMKCIPDFVAKDRFIEVMGFGRDQTLKIKCYKLDALDTWDVAVGPVYLWVYDSSTDRCWDAPLYDWAIACQSKATIEKFPDNDAKYYALHVDHFPEGSLVSC